MSRKAYIISTLKVLNVHPDRVGDVPVCLWNFKYFVPSSKKAALVLVRIPEIL